MLKLNATFELPRRLRTFVRARELSRILLAAVAGAIAGLVVTIMGGVDVLHSILFSLDPGERLSGRFSLNPQYAFLTPCLGGVLFGLVSTIIAHRRGAEIDPIEANALHGGHMSMRGSLIVATQTVWSSGLGPRSGSRPATPSSPAGSLRASARLFICAEAICACSSAAARLVP